MAPNFKRKTQIHPFLPKLTLSLLSLILSSLLGSISVASESLSMYKVSQNGNNGDNLSSFESHRFEERKSPKSLRRSLILLICSLLLHPLMVRPQIPLLFPPILSPNLVHYSSIPIKPSISTIQTTPKSNLEIEFTHLSLARAESLLREHGWVRLEEPHSLMSEP